MNPVSSKISDFMPMYSCTK